MCSQMSLRWATALVFTIAAGPACAAAGGAAAFRWQHLRRARAGHAALGQLVTTGGRCIDRHQVRGVAIFHGLSSDPFWQGVERSAKGAAKALGIRLDVSLAERFDTLEMAQRIRLAAKDKPSFLVVSIPGGTVIDAVRDAVALNVPVFAANAGSDVAPSLGVLNFVGSDNVQGGRLAASRLKFRLRKNGGMEKGICILHQKGNSAMQERCAGMAQYLEQAGIAYEEVEVLDGDDAKVRRTLKSRLNPVAGATGVLVASSTLLPLVFERLDILNAGVEVATFDANQATYQAMEDGKVFAIIDGGTWLQGALPVVSGALYATTGERLPETNFRTGPKVLLKVPGLPYRACADYSQCPPLGSLRVVAATHGVEADPFWQVVRKGAEQAADDFGVSMSFVLPDRFEEAWMERKIQGASAEGTALVVSLPSAAVVPTIAAAAARVPVISINTGSELARSAHSLHHIGMDEGKAAQAVGQKMLAMGSCKRPVCLVHNPRIKAFSGRCAGFRSALAGAADGDFKEVPVEPEHMEPAIRKLVSKTDPDCVLLTSAQQVRAMEAAGTKGRRVGTFDFDQQIGKSLSSQQIAFGVDQQPYLQGYLPVVLLVAKLSVDEELADEFTLAGPTLVSGASAMDAQHLADMEGGFRVCPKSILSMSFGAPARAAAAPSPIRAGLPTAVVTLAVVVGMAAGLA